jgi:hypothetical protein
MWDEFVLRPEPAATTPAPIETKTNMPPPFSWRGHWARIPAGYRQRLARREATEANAGGESPGNSDWPPQRCGTGLIHR